MSVDILCDDRLAFAFVIGDHQLHRIKDSAYTRSRLFEVFANGVLQQTLVDHTFHFRVTDLVHECADGLRGITAATQTAYRRHTRVIPSGYQTFFDELQHLALRHHGVGDVQTVELPLFGTVVRSVG